MSDIDRVYNALLRAERRLEITATDANYPQAAELARPARIALQTLREEIGGALSEYPAPYGNETRGSPP